MNGLLYAGTGVPRPLILNPRMNEFPVPIERLKREFGQPVVENECPQPEAEDHRLHDVLWNRHDSAELKCELYVLESESHLAFCIAFGRGRLPEPGLWDSTRAPTSSVATSPVFENSKMSAGLTFALRNNATISLLNSRRSDSVIGREYRSMRQFRCLSYGWVAAISALSTSSAMLDGHPRLPRIRLYVPVRASLMFSKYLL
jgi:hypothetical protein